MNKRKLDEYECTLSVNDIKCPITTEIFLKPVIASDGFNYELCAIKRVIDESKISPITREPLTDVTIPNKKLKCHIDQVLSKDADLAQEQFKDTFYKEYEYRKQEFIDALLSGRYDTVIDTKNIPLNDTFIRYDDKGDEVRTSIMQTVCNISNIPIKMTLIKSASSVHISDRQKNTLVHHLAKDDNNIDIVKYLVEERLVNYNHQNSHQLLPYNIALASDCPKLSEYLFAHMISSYTLNEILDYYPFINILEHAPSKTITNIFVAISSYFKENRYPSLIANSHIRSFPLEHLTASIDAIQQNSKITAKQKLKFIHRLIDLMYRPVV